MPGTLSNPLSSILPAVRVVAHHPAPGSTNSKLPLIWRGDSSRPRGGGPGRRCKTPTLDRAGFGSWATAERKGLRLRAREGETKGGGPAAPQPGVDVPLGLPGGGVAGARKAALLASPGPPPPALPVILSLQELEFVFDPVTGLGHSEFKSRLPGLMGCLEPTRTT